MKYLPLIRKQDVAMKNDGKQIVLRIRGQEYEFKRDTVKELLQIAEYILQVKSPTGWVTGEADFKKKEETDLLWQDGVTDDDMP
jgi:hypothetical protein